MDKGLGIAGAITSAIGTVGNLIGGAIQNRKQRKFEEQMYEKQKQDNLAFWEKQNLYNSPVQQMDRLKQAGLNPNLVYGNGSAANTADSIKSPDKPNWRPQSLDFRNDSINNYVDLKMKNAQMDLLNEQNKIAQQEQIYKAAMTNKVLADTENSKFKYRFSSRLEETNYELAQQRLRQLMQNNMFSAGTYELNQRLGNQKFDLNSKYFDLANKKTQSQLMNDISQRATQAQQRTHSQYQIQLIQSNIAKLEADTRMQEIENELAEKGIFRGDPAYMRILNEMATELTAVNTGYKALDAILNSTLRALRARPKRTTKVTTRQSNGRTTTNTFTR